MVVNLRKHMYTRVWKIINKNKILVKYIIYINQIIKSNVYEYISNNEHSI